MSDSCDTFLKCDRCLPAKCCSYVSMELDKPEELADYENLLWYVAHNNIHVYISEKRWYMNIVNRCNFLGEDNRCTIYERRPQICRDYSLDGCEYDATEADYGYDQYFENFDQLEMYIWKKFGKRYVKDAPLPVGYKPTIKAKRVFPKRQSI
ncbi:MAG: YkgJ family cysteine cluster protein [Bacteriovoracaceae bacterium]